MRSTNLGPRGVARSGIVALLCLVAGALAAYHFVFQRPGEAALSLIPSDALVVATLDTRPSVRQAALFQRIRSAMAREGADADVERAVTRANHDAPVVWELRPYLQDNFALALLKLPSG